MFLPPRGLLWRRWQSLKLHYHIHAAAMLPHFIYKTGLFCILENVSWWMFRSDSAILDYLNKTQVSTSFGAKPPWQLFKIALHFKCPSDIYCKSILNYHIHASAMLPHFISKAGLLCLFQIIFKWLYHIHFSCHRNSLSHHCKVHIFLCNTRQQYFRNALNFETKPGNNTCASCY